MKFRCLRSLFFLVYLLGFDRQIFDVKVSAAVPPLEYSLKEAGKDERDSESSFLPITTDDDINNDESAFTNTPYDDDNGIDDGIDCLMRRLFFERAQKAVPWRKNNMQDVYDALELETRCKNAMKGSENDDYDPHPHLNKALDATNNDDNNNITSKGRRVKEELSGRSKRRKNPRLNNPNINTISKTYFFVCSRTGIDSETANHRGNVTHPFATLERAIQASRDLRQRQRLQQSDVENNNGSTRSDTTVHGRHVVVLQEGIHFLKSTIVLTPADSYLTIRSFGNNNNNDTKVWISGGVFINSQTTKWKPVESTDAFLKQKNNIWVSDLSSLNLKDVTGLFTVQPHNRMTLARYPNANVENWNDPNRHISSKEVHEWMFPPMGEVPTFDTIDLSKEGNPTGHVKNDSTMDDYNRYGTGQGGACASVWGDLPSYWCSNVSAGGWAFVDKAAALLGRMNIPKGVITLNTSSTRTRKIATDDDDETSIFDRMNRWDNPNGGIVHVSHSQGWAWHMFNISHLIFNASTATLYFDKGGWQGGRNWECIDANGHMTDCTGEDKRLKGGNWYVEGIKEELDAPEEFFYDREKQLLYFYPPTNIERDDECCSMAESTKTKREKCCCVPDLVATNLQTLIKIQGTQENPVRGIQLKGLGFRDAAKTYMEQWSAPSGGDWALHRGGAIHLDGATDIVISDSIFRRLDGNAIMLSGYCRNNTISRSEFSWIGNGALATWGDTDGYDATGGTQPRFTTVEQNVMKELGLYQKQSSGWGQNKACQNMIRNNLMFNLPRAAINFNDGLGGGNLVKGNVIFNTCRESGDHGPINSWDRMPFLINTSGNEPSFAPAPTRTTQNLILANYGASQGFDNDDGSSWYHTYSNVYYSADGFKMDYGGHDSIFASNLVYAQNKHCFGTGSFLKGHEDKFYNNTCIVVDDRSNPPQNNIGTLFQCSTDGMNPSSNRYYTNNGNATWKCPSNSEPLTLYAMQNMGFEQHSTVSITPPASTIVSWAKEILGVSNRTFVSVV